MAANDSPSTGIDHASDGAFQHDMLQALKCSWDVVVHHQRRDNSCASVTKRLSTVWLIGPMDQCRLQSATQRQTRMYVLLKSRPYYDLCEYEGASSCSHISQNCSTRPDLMTSSWPSEIALLHPSFSNWPDALQSNTTTDSVTL